MSQVGPMETSYFEDILPNTGWGLYYKFMLGMAFVASFAQATAFLSVPFCIPLSTCEHAITKEISLNLYLSLCLGRTVGGFLLNVLGDIFGRKRFLSYSLLLIFMSTFMAAFAFNYYVIMVAAFILASGLEANVSIVRIHLAEILPKQRRGYYLAICDIFWTFGYLFISLLAILLKAPAIIEHRAVDMNLTTWRMLFALSGGLHIMLACAAALLEESPRYFLHIKKHYLAMLTLKQFYAINKSSYGDSLEVRESDLHDVIHDYNLSIYTEPEGRTSPCKTLLVVMYKSMKMIFSERFFKLTIVLLIIKTPLLIFGPLSVNILLAKQLDPNSTVVEGIDIIYLETIENQSMCSSMEENMTLYYIYFILAACNFVGQIFVMLLVDIIGRKCTAFMGLLMCGACFVSLFYIKDPITEIVLSTVLMVFHSVATSVVSIINIESYPTAIRGTSWGALNFPGVFLSIFLVRTYHLFADYFYMIVGPLFFGAAAATCLIQELKKKPMIE